MRLTAGHVTCHVSAGRVRPANENMGQMAGGGDNASAEERSRSQTTVRQQTRQTAAGQRRDQGGANRNVTPLSWTDIIRPSSYTYALTFLFMHKKLNKSSENHQQKAWKNKSLA